MEVDKIVDTVAPIVDGCKNGQDVGNVIMVFGKAIGVLSGGFCDRAAMEAGLQIVFTAIRATAVAVHSEMHQKIDAETFLRDHFTPEKQNG